VSSELTGGSGSSQNSTKQRTGAKIIAEPSRAAWGASGPEAATGFSGSRSVYGPGRPGPSSQEASVRSFPSNVKRQGFERRSISEGSQRRSRERHQAGGSHS
jgi:hypothetical protein